MSSIQRAIRDDVREYLDLCHAFNEKPRYRPTRWGQVADAYGDHARALRARSSQETTNERRID